MDTPNWIDDIISEVSADIETPHSWLWWSLIAAISATASNNYRVISFNGNHVYKPNLYIMLLGDSGKGKAYGITLAQALVRKADVTRVIAGRSSIQAILTDLATTKSNANGKPPLQDSRAFIVNGELSSAIIADVSALAIMTDLYDGKFDDEWTNNLKMGKEKLKDPCITALFGSSPSHFYGTIPMDNIQGGYIGRNLIVYEEKQSQIVDPFGEDDDKVDDKIRGHILPKYVKHLEEINSKKGRLLLTKEAKEMYNPWRRKWKTTDFADRTGFMTRVPDHVIKVAMCLCLSRYHNAGIINEFDIEESIRRVTHLIYANKMTTEGRGIDPSAAQSKRVIEILIRAENNEMTRKRLLTAGHGDFDSYALDRILDNLVEMGYVTKTRTIGNHDWDIKLAGDALESYKKWKVDNEKNK